MSGNQPGLLSEMLKTHAETKQTMAMAGEVSKGVLGLFQIVIFAPAITITVLTRRNFGVRYLGPGRVIFGCIASGILGLIDPYLVWVMPLFIVLVIAHHVWGARQRSMGMQVHSFCMGDHWPFFWKITKNPSLIMAIEPLAVIFIGATIAPIMIPTFLPLGMYLMLAGIGIALENVRIAGQLRNQILNAMDQRIESQQSAQLMNAQPSPQAPFQVPQPIPQGYQVGAAPTVAQAHQNLDPALKAMMEPKTAPQVYTISSESPQNAEMFPRTATMIGGS